MMKKMIGLVGLAFLGALAGRWLSQWSVTFCGWHLWAGGLALATAPLAISEEDLKQFQDTLSQFKDAWAGLKRLPDALAEVQGRS